MKLGIASDHRGYKLKEEIKEVLDNVKDYGTNNEESCDYPDYAYKLSQGVLNNEVDFGIAICGSGIGISIACNKVKGIRCAKVSTPEEATYTRNDNDSNIVAFSEQTDLETALQIIDKFINTPFSNEEKHLRRINKIKEIEEGTYEG